MLELRVATEVLLAALLFAVDVHLLEKCDYNLHSAFGFSVTASTICDILRPLAAIYAVGCSVILVQAWLFPGFKSRILATILLTGMVSLIFIQRRFRNLLKRVAVGQISNEHRLGDILVSDGMVSLSSVLVDMALCFSLTAQSVPLTAPTNREKYLGPCVLLVACIPPSIRMSQCIRDYSRSLDGAHLLNFVKYSISNSVNLARIVCITEAYNHKHAQRWLELLLLVNAVYSAAWDLIADWKLHHLHKRRTRIAKRWYAVAAVTDVALRFAFLASYKSEVNVFILQTLEILRRSIWIFFRVDSEDTHMDAVKLG